MMLEHVLVLSAYLFSIGIYGLIDLSNRTLFSSLLKTDNLRANMKRPGTGGMKENFKSARLTFGRKQARILSSLH